jgi:mono/diheme cytochrome c family protein
MVATLSCALGQEAGDPVAGLRLAEASCMLCHAPTDGPKRAPAFAAIAATPSTTALSLRVFLQSSHPPMPNLMLSQTERDDLVAYILSLRR